MAPSLLTVTKEDSSASEKKAGDMDLHHSREEFIKSPGEMWEGRKMLELCKGGTQGRAKWTSEGQAHHSVLYKSPPPSPMKHLVWSTQLSENLIYQDVRSPASGGRGGCTAGMGTMY